MQWNGLMLTKSWVQYIFKIATRVILLHVSQVMSLLWPKYPICLAMSYEFQHDMGSWYLLGLTQTTDHSYPH